MTDRGDGVSLGDIVALEQIDVDRFRGTAHLTNHTGALFGGTLIAQAVRAAELSAGGRALHSLHAYFYRSVSTRSPIDIVVERTRDGASFSSRRVTVWQDGKRGFEALMSLQVPEDGFAHEAAWTTPPPPPLSVPTLLEVAEALGDKMQAGQREMIRHFARSIEARVINADDFLLRRADPVGRIWLRPTVPVGAAPESSAYLAFLSDFLLPAACSLPHLDSSFSLDLMSASLDHAIWFHAPSPADAWLLYEIESPWSGGARGLGLGRLYDEAGRLLASTAQEQVVRVF